MHYKTAKKWMWCYCTYLGEYTTKGGQKYDMGVYWNKVFKKPSMAIVFSDVEYSYFSGSLYSEDDTEDCEAMESMYKELRVRWENHQKVLNGTVLPF